MFKWWALVPLVLLIPTGALAQNDPADLEACARGDVDAMIAACSRLIETKRLSKQYLAGSYMNRGVSYSRKMQHDRAIADLSEAIKLDPNDALFYFNRGHAYIDKAGPVEVANKDELDRAIADFSKAISLNPKFADAFFGRAKAYIRKKTSRSSDLGIADIKRAQELDPKKYPKKQ